MTHFETGVIVISVYNPDIDFGARLLKLAKEYKRIIVVDDCSNMSTSYNITDLPKNGNIHIVKLTENVGTAGALSFGIHLATKLWSPDWFITLDQDSMISNKYIHHQLESWKSAIVAGIDVGLIGPNLLSNRKGSTSIVHNSFTIVNFTLQSGAMIPKETLKQIGDLDTTLFMDGLDTEYSIRAVKSGLTIISSANATLMHQISDPGILPITILGQSVVIKKRARKYLWRPPFRTYYSTRNSLIIGRKHKINLFFQFWYFKFLLLQVLLGPARIKHLIAIFYGVRDGITGKSGKIPKHLQTKLMYINQKS